MLKRGLSQLLRRVVASSALPQAHYVRVVAASRLSAAGSALAHRENNVPWLQQRVGISIAGDGADSHDDFKPVQRDGSSLPSVQEHIETLGSSPSRASTIITCAVRCRWRPQDVKENPVLVYMKGVPDAPQCGFSAMVVRILDEYGVQYKTRNVLTDPELRTAIKEYSNWPTIPQLYVNGEFVGGSDIVISMHRGA